MLLFCGFQKKRDGLAIGTFMKVSGLERHLGFNWNFIGKTGTHLMEIRFNNRGRFIKLPEFRLIFVIMRIISLAYKNSLF